MMDLNIAGNNIDDGGGDDGSYAINDYMEFQTIFDPQNAYSITAATFDPQQELFWTGNTEGRVTSFYGLQMSKYTSFRVQSEPECDIRMLYASQNNNDIYVLTSNTLASYSRLGFSNFKHKEVSFKNLQCLFFNQQERFFLGGYSDAIYDFDIERLRVLRQLNIGDEQSDCILIKSSSSSTTSMNQPQQQSSISRAGILCTGSTNGKIYARDPFTLKSIHKFHPHNGSLSDFDVHGNYMVSCGFSATRNGNLCVDRFLMVYDLRMMRALNPIQLMIEPCFIHYLPMYSSVVAVASQSACFQLCDTNLMTPSSFYQAQVPPIGMATTFSMSSNRQAAAFGHSSGSVHLFTKSENAYFNDFSDQTLFVDPPQFDGNIFIDINDEITSLSSLPVPITSEKHLISDVPNMTESYGYRPTQPISDELMKNSRIIHGIISVPNRINLIRNQAFNQSYKDYLNELADNSAKTSIRLEDMLEPSVTATTEASDKQTTDSSETLDQTKPSTSQSTDNVQTDDEKKSSTNE